MEGLFLPLLLMLVVAVPLVLGTRKQKKAMREQQELQSNLAEGDRVMTTSGLYATVADISGDTTIDLEIAPGVVTTWLRQGVRERVAPEVAEDGADGEESAVADEATEDTTSTSASAEAKAEEPQVAPPLEHGKK